MSVEIRNLTYKYPNSPYFAIKNLSYYIDSGEIKVIVGASGSGKTTLARLMAGLSEGEVKGSITYEERDLTSLPYYERVNSCILMQQDANSSFVTNTLREELHFMLDNLMLDIAQKQERMQELVTNMNLSAMMDIPIKELSEGEKEIAALACVLAIRARLSVLDEPFAHLDEDSADQLLIYIHRQARKYKMSFLIVDHLVERWLDVGDDVAIIQNGHILVDGIRKGNFEAYESVFESEGLLLPFARPLRRYYERKHEEGMKFEGYTLVHPRYEAVIIDDLNVNFPPGMLIGIHGKSQSGKSTFLNSIIFDNYEGDIILDGKSLNGKKYKKRLKQIAYVKQGLDDVFIRATVREELIDALLMSKVYNVIEECQRECDHLLMRLGLTPFEAMSPYSLSLGKQRLLAIVLALYSRQKWVLIDEISYGMDRKSLDLIFAIAKEMKEKGKTLIFTSNNEFVVRNYAEMIFKLEDEILEEYV